MDGRGAIKSSFDKKQGMQNYKNAHGKRGRRAAERSFVFYIVRNRALHHESNGRPTTGK